MTCSFANSPELNKVAGLFLESVKQSLNFSPGSPSASCGVSVCEGSVSVKKEAMLAEETRGNTKMHVHFAVVGV